MNNKFIYDNSQYGPDISEDVKKIICFHVGAEMEDVRLDSKLVSDLGYDELDFVEMIIQLEQKFSVSIPDYIFTEFGGKDSEDSISIHDITVCDCINIIKKANGKKKIKYKRRR